MLTTRKYRKRASKRVIFSIGSRLKGNGKLPFGLLIVGAMRQSHGDAPPGGGARPSACGCAGEVKGAAAGAPARTVLGLSRGSFAFQAPETWHAPVSMGLPESLQLFDETG